MYSSDEKPGQFYIKMDPDCALCHAPASHSCNCEARSLEVAVKQAESRIMQSIYDEIRSWVRLHAQDYILEHFKQLTERRKAAHAEHLDQLTAHSYHYYHAAPHPNEIASAQATLKRGIDDDWQASVQRYPEVLEYFYSLVSLSVPADSDAEVKDPPLTAIRKVHRRSAPALPQVPYEQEPAGALTRRSPPPLHGRRERRRDSMTPGPMMAHPHAPPPDRRPRTAFRGERHAPPPAPYYHPHPNHY